MRTIDTTKAQIVKDSFNALRPSGDFLAALFYERLFVLAPDAKHLFRKPAAAQYRMLMFGLSTIVRDIDRVEELSSFVQALSRSHAGYGVASHHYKAAQDALLYTLESGLGPSFTLEVREAWSATFESVFSEMQCGPRESTS